MARCTVPEFREWVEHFQREPWGEYGMDLRAARLGMILLATAGVKRARPGDVLPWLESSGGGVDWAERERSLEAMMRLSGVKFEVARG